MHKPLAAFASCLPGLEPLLAGELQALGTVPAPAAGGVEFAADLALAQRACLWLGTASHVLIRLGSFHCRALGELQRKAAGIPWAQWLRADVPLDLRATARKSRLFHTGAITERVEAAIAEALGAPPPQAAGDANDAGPPAARVAVRLFGDECTVSIDATSTPLHRRGYRLDGGKAPLREDLAHALLLAAGGVHGRAVLDPFCGSGTLAIEAAGLAYGLPPGRLRPPPFVHLAPFDAALWRSLAAERRTPADTIAPIRGSDRDAGAIEAARANAGRAGLAEAIDFDCLPISAQPWLSGDGTAPAVGLLATNPPYGRRIGAQRSLLPLYQTLGARAARLGPGWQLAMLTHDVRLGRRTGRPLRAVFTTRHGGLGVTALVSAGESESESEPDPAARNHSPGPP